MKRPLTATRTVVLRAAVLGLATGGRSAVGLAAMAMTTDSDDPAPPLAALTGPVLSRAVQLMSAGGMGADLPSTSSRLAGPALASRVGAGGISAFTLAKHSDVPVGLPVLAGLLGAAVGALGGARWRMHAARQGWPELTAALVEDVVVVALAAAVTRQGSDAAGR